MLQKLEDISVDYNGKIKCKINILCLFVTEVVSLSGPQNRVNKLTTFWINPFPNRYVIKIAQSSFVIKGRFVGGGGLREQCGKREDGRADVVRWDATRMRESVIAPNLSWRGPNGLVNMQERAATRGQRKRAVIEEVLTSACSQSSDRKEDRSQLYRK